MSIKLPPDAYDSVLPLTSAPALAVGPQPLSWSRAVKQVLGLAVLLALACFHYAGSAQLEDLASSLAQLGPGSMVSSSAGKGRVKWTACGDANNDIDCAHITVPLDWDNPKLDARRVVLSVNRIRATPAHGAKRLGSIFV